jgi:endonuclease/exonuclease/phosphatase family metal-dependent hydrolase/ubiquinone/menaquinone biosynthesis C-methylase UbiE
MIIKFIQWNICYHEKVDKIIELLKRLDADIICLQELSGNTVINPNIRTDIRIGKELGLFSYCEKTQEWSNWEKEYQANGIFSKFPIIESKKTILHSSHSPSIINFSEEGRIYIEALIEIQDFHLYIGTTHLSYSHKFLGSIQKEEEEKKLIKAIKHRNNYIFSGDLNAPPNSNIVNQLLKKFKHCGPDFESKTWTTKPFDYNGFIENELNWRLDYIFSTKDIVIKSSEIIETDISDHLPILIYFELKTKNLPVFLKRTINTYEKIAEEYEQRRQYASPVNELNQIITYTNRGKILDAGCGPGRDAKYLSENGIDVIGIDLCNSFLRMAKIKSKNSIFKKMNILDLKFSNETFDGIWCCVVLSHFKKSWIPFALKELFRVLKRNGILFIAVKLGEGEGYVTEKEFIGHPQRFISYFTDIEIASMLKTAGFSVFKQYHYNELDRHGGNHRDIPFIFSFSRKVD